ncbi:LytR/AlgR family response regulator transcription factor [Flavivirga rizhaonensis]|uniref:LytTR family transcriptional regulator n=1 Tax=Flavivirga rizhaonensis TaxID=2559571 RepID=A0A4S1DUT5_9FLAO|nr:LytTR family DNA-binding domain-containing protein [Flavivirga rizhaonensis]TGV01182.1 LytTR family transcriptional regulator [Flavivirga rizhaonensis]
MVRVLIIEDETISSKHIINLLKDYSSETFIMEAITESVLDTIKWFMNNDDCDMDRLLKIISQKNSDPSISKLLRLKKKAKKNKSLKTEDRKIDKERFLVKLGKKYIPLKTEDIAYFYKDDIVFAKSFNGNSYPINSSLNTIESLIDTNTFFRVNRKMIININAIEYLAQYRPGQLTIKVSPKFEEIIILSQEKSSGLKALLSYSL